MSAITLSTARPKLALRTPHRGWQLAVVVVLALIGYAALRTKYPFPSWLQLRAQQQLDKVYQWVVANRDTSPLFTNFFNYIALGLFNFVHRIDALLLGLGWPGVIAVAAGLAARFSGWRVAVFTAVGFAIFGLLGLWDESMATLALMIASVLIALAIGIPLGIASAGSDRFSRVLAPVLDAAQIMPAFAYLMPIVLAFGIGTAPAAVATVIYAVPPAVRITNLAIRGVPKPAVEAATSMGSTGRQLLMKVRLPLAKRTIMLAVNQTIMLAMSMVVIASIIGAGGLGDEIFRSLENVDVGGAFNAGLAIVVMAIVLDRSTAAAGARSEVRRRAGVTVSPQRRRLLLLGGMVAVLAVIVLARVLTVHSFPDNWAHSVASPVNRFADWVQVHLGWTGAISTFLVKDVFNPLRAFLTDSPWWVIVGGTALLGQILSGWRLAIVTAVAMTMTGSLGLWNDSMDTLSQVIAASIITIALGIVIGIGCARSDTALSLLRPILDAAQTMPSFVYLIPVVALFAAGRTPGVIAAVVFALPVVIRLTNDGIRGVPATTVEAALAAGSSSWQLLWKVQLPVARPAILLAVNQGIMMVLAMVIVGALVGAGALGYDVLLGLSRNQLGLGICAGISIVCLGVVLDRLTQSAARSPAGSRSMS